MIVYRIYHKATGKSYVGQTIHPTFNHRYSGGRWWDITDNPLLRNAYRKHGKDAFSIEILESSVSSLEELNRLEEAHAVRLGAYAPLGYNLRGCGDNRRLLPHQIEAIGKAKSKSYTLRKVDTWELIEVTNLKAFCRERGITSGSMYNMVNENLGIVVAHGYCLSTRTKEEVAERASRAFRGKTFVLVREGGETVTVTSLKLFAKERGLEIGSLHKLIKGQMLFYKGWRLPERVGEPLTTERSYDLIGPTGERCSGIGVTRFCRERGLRYHGVLQVLLGDRLHCSGWHLPSTSPEEVSRRRRTS